MKVLPTMGSMYSGSLRGITAAHNKGGLYFRGRTIPTNPNTSRQQSVRAAMGGLMNTWSDDLSESERQSWRDYAANVSVTDSLGQSMNLSGVNQFIRSNVPLAQLIASPLVIAASTVDSAPPTFNTGEPVQDVTAFNGDFTTPPGTVSIEGTLAGAAPVGGIVLLYVAPPQTPGTRFYAGPYQLAAAQAITADDTDFDFDEVDLDTTDEWASDTVPVAAWDGLFVPLKLVVAYLDGRRSEVWRSLVQFADETS